eukprot:gene16253-22429_t
MECPPGALGENKAVAFGRCCIERGATGHVGNKVFEHCGDSLPQMFRSLPCMSTEVSTLDVWVDDVKPSSFQLHCRSSDPLSVFCLEGMAIQAAEQYFGLQSISIQRANGSDVRGVKHQVLHISVPENSEAFSKHFKQEEKLDSLAQASVCSLDAPSFYNLFPFHLILDSQCNIVQDSQCNVVQEIIYVVDASASVCSLDAPSSCNLFPFHLILDSQCNIVQAGSALLKVMPELENGSTHAAKDAFELQHPASLAWDFQSLKEHSRTHPTITLATKYGLQLKGRVMLTSVPLTTPEGQLLQKEAILFLVFPKFDGLDDMKDCGFCLSDLPQYGMSVDLVLASESQEELEAMRTSSSRAHPSLSKPGVPNSTKSVGSSRSNLNPLMDRSDRSSRSCFSSSIVGLSGGSFVNSGQDGVTEEELALDVVRRLMLLREITKVMPISDLMLVRQVLVGRRNAPNFEVTKERRLKGVFSSSFSPIQESTVETWCSKSQKHLRKSEGGCRRNSSMGAINISTAGTALVSPRTTDPGNVQERDDEKKCVSSKRYPKSLKQVSMSPETSCSWRNPHGSNIMGSVKSALMGMKSRKNEILSCSREAEFLVQLMKQPSDELAIAFSTIDHWQYDIFQLSEAAGGRPLSALAFMLFKQGGIISSFKVDEQKLARFLIKIEDGYSSHPYHC